MELGLVSPLTVANTLAALLQEYQLQGRKSTETTQHHIKPVLRLLGERQATSLTTPVLRQYAQARLGEGKSPATINREFAALRRALSLAQTDGTLERVPTFPMLRETGLRQGTYTREEFERIVQALAPHLRPVAWFGYLTGRRRGEILQIRWADVHLEEGYITIRASTTKTGQPDTLPISEELMTLIRGLDSTTVYLFEYHGKPFKSFQRSWKRAAQKAGLPDKLFHDLRRSVATDLIEAGVDQKTAMAITGHRTTAVFNRYHIVKQTEVRSALEKLNSYRKGTSNDDSGTDF